MLAAEQRTVKNYCHLFGQIADYLALAFHMLGTLQTEKIAQNRQVGLLGILRFWQQGKGKNENLLRL